jgi:hypothetical protein
MAPVIDIALLSLSSFLGNVGVALTGFGMAIIYLFVWQIAVIAGYDSNFKYAVFIQALALFSAQVSPWLDSPGSPPLSSLIAHRRSVCFLPSHYCYTRQRFASMHHIGCCATSSRSPLYRLRLDRSLVIECRRTSWRRSEGSSLHLLPYSRYTRNATSLPLGCAAISVRRPRRIRKHRSV